MLILKFSATVFFEFPYNCFPIQNQFLTMPLFLLPVPVSDTKNHEWVGQQYIEVVKNSKLFFVENVRTARRWVASLKTGISIDQLQFEVVDKNTSSIEIKRLGKMMQDQENIVLMSEAGCPGIADPGAAMVEEAHQLGIPVVPLVGPSSIVLALMATGFSGQQFCFHGYLPIDKSQRIKKIKQLELESGQKTQAQIFIETPYRNAALWEAFLEALHPATDLAFAQDLLGPSQKIERKKVKDWKNGPERQWNKVPVVFLFQSGKN